MFKRFLFFILFAVSCMAVVYGQQQITRIGVIDLPRVYQSFFAESRAVREWEEKSAGVQRDIDRMTNEISNLRNRLADAIKQDNQSEITRLENEVNRRAENLRNFYQSRTEQLERERQNLMQSGNFLDQVYNEIRIIGESEGFTMVLNRANSPFIVWYSSSVDITDKLIANLRRSRR